MDIHEVEVTGAGHSKAGGGQAATSLPGCERAAARGPAAAAAARPGVIIKYHTCIVIV